MFLLHLLNTKISLGKFTSIFPCLLIIFSITATQAQFTQVAGANGLDDSNSGAVNGQAWGDLNNDGNLDVIIHIGVSGNQTNSKMFFNTGAPNFDFRDTTDFLIDGFNDDRSFGRQMLIVDLNNDGYNDIVRGHGGSVDTEIFFNDGPPSFTFGNSSQQPDVLIGAPPVGSHNTEGIVAIDWNQDGWLDLIIDNDDGGNDVYENDQLGGFNYIPAGTAVGETGFPASHAGDGDYMTAADIDNDGYVDLYGRKTDVTNLWMFNPAISQFETQATPDINSSEGDKGGTMFCDFDNDGDLDLLWTSFGNNEIWRNDGAGTWVATGIPAAPISTQSNIDGCDCGDVDNDGDLDIILSASGGNSYLLENTTVGATLSFSTTNIATSTDAESSTFSDYDNDGDLDLYIVSRTSENQLWENGTNDNNHLYVNALVENADGSTRDAIGANVFLTTCDGTVSGMRQVNGGKGHGSQHQTKVHFGLDPTLEYIVEVHYVYKNGTRSIVKRAVVPEDEANQEITILDTEGNDFSVCNTISSTDDFNVTPFNTPVSSSVKTNDVDSEGDNQTFALDGANGGMNAADGTVVFNADGTYTYTPANGFTGETSFQYSVCDDGAPMLCDTATVYIEIFTDVDPMEETVLANPDANTVEAGSTGTGNVLSNDQDPDAIDPGVITTLSGMTVPGIDEDGNPVTDAGTLTLNSDGTYTFVPTAGFTGEVIQEYIICDGALPALACDTTNLIITVIADNGNSTFASDDAVVTDAGVPASGDISTNDTDSEADNQTISEFMVDTDGDGDGDILGTVGSPTTVGGTDENGTYVANAGSLTLLGDGTYTFTPAVGFSGNVLVPYTTCDDDLVEQACAEATLDITVLEINRDYGDAPAAYPAAWHRAITDGNDDQVLDGVSDIWLGSNTSFESSQVADPTAAADTHDDAMTFGIGTGDFPTNIAPNTSYNVDLTLNSNSSQTVHYGVWIDWGEDGDYETFIGGFQTINGSTDVSISVLTPGSFGAAVNVRLRVDNDALSSADYIGGKTNGEIEDHQAGISLPVELISFSGKSTDCNIQLDWRTNSEKDFSHFEIERSIDGQSFSSLQILPSTHFRTANSDYRFVDNTNTVKNYYRLKMVDENGTYEYSEVILVKTDCGIKDIVLFPNPISPGAETINVKFYSEYANTQIQVSSMLGKLLKTVEYDVRAKKENIVQLDISDLPSGTYIIKFEGEATSRLFFILE